MAGIPEGRAGLNGQTLTVRKLIKMQLNVIIAVGVQHLAEAGEEARSGAKLLRLQSRGASNPNNKAKRLKALHILLKLNDRAKKQRG